MSPPASEFVSSSAWSPDQIRAIEECAVRGWPATEVVDLDGWQLRATAGITRRANSVATIREASDRSLDDRIRIAENFYRDRGLLPMFQVSLHSQPAMLSDALIARGYTVASQTLLQVAPIESLLNAPVDDASPVDLFPEWSPTWFGALCDVWGFRGQDASQREGILRRTGTRLCGAMTLPGIDGGSVGFAVIDGDWMGIFGVATSESLRGRGAARAVLSNLAHWAHALGARYSYLQVVKQNHAARRLYSKLGFQTATEYCYRVLERH